MHWEVVELFNQGGTVLRTYEHDQPRWDPQFLRALSATCDGFVQGLEQDRSRERYGEATMFAGRTIELMEYDGVTGVQGLGLPPHYEFTTSAYFYEVHRQRFVKLCDITGEGEPWQTRVVAAGEWELSPAVEGFSTEDEKATTRALPGLGVSGWRWRAFHTPRLDSACIEIARDGTLDRELVARLGQDLDAPYVAFEVPGGGRPMPYAQWFGEGEASVGEAVGFEQLFSQLVQIAGMYSEGVGMLFGSGNAGWHEI
jgi:hypothetical protein